MKITIKNLQNRIPISAQITRRITRAIRKTLSAHSPARTGEITLCLVNNCRIRMLNRKFLGKDTPTDVIAFDLGARTGGPLAADIAVSADMACANAAVFKTRPLQELYLYVIHGVLHLLGWRDDTPRKQKRMQKKADSILGEICPAKKQKR